MKATQRKGHFEPAQQRLDGMLEAKTKAQTEVAATADPSSGARNASAMTAAGKRSKLPLARGVLLWPDSWKMAVDVIGRVDGETAKKRREEG